ncbi:MAG: 1,6-anhydro-N-acetylmuramyl-L-alanine amidase AmpD [Candidatus Methylopumilus sp.]|nr:1,6-anhydro-N-acetylmuramyl-L-alanine amidase AmpD [Candidatus Methylopumilus sp.]
MNASILIDDFGFTNKAEVILSPNFDNRPDHHIKLIVIHNISLPPKVYGGNSIINLFTNKLNPNEHEYFKSIYDIKVSSHFLIRRDGQLIQFVSCLNRAWHAGESIWKKIKNCNDFSIGIELEGSDYDAFEEKQYISLNTLLDNLIRQYPIEDIVGHSDIAPLRKTDPGPYFDWDEIKSHKNELIRKR